MKRWLIGGVLIVAIAGAGYAAAELYARQRAPAVVDALFMANGLTATHGPVAYTLGGDRLTVEGVDAQSDRVAETGWSRLRIAHLEITGIDPLGMKALLSGHWDRIGRPSGPDRIEGQIIEIDATDGSTVSAARLALAEPRFDAFVAPLDIPAGIATASRFAARSLELGDLKVTTESGTVTAELGSLTASDIGQGRIGKLSADRIEVNGPSLYGPTRIALAGITASGLEDRNILILAYSPFRQDELLKPLWDDMAVSGFAMANPDAEVKFDRLTLSGLQARRVQAFPEIPSSFAVRDADLDGLVVTSHRNREARLATAKLHVTGVEPGRVASASIERMVLDADNETNARLDAASLQDLAYGDWTRLGTPRPRLSLRHMAVGPITVSQRGKVVGSIATLASEMTVDENGVPIASSLKLDKLSLAGELLHQGALGQEIAALGYGELLFDMTADGVYDTGTSSMVLHETLIVGPKVGKLAFSLRLGNVPADLETAAPDVQLQRLAGMTIDKAELRYDDDSLGERLIRRTAIKAGMTPDQMRGGLIAQLRAFQQALHKGSRAADMIDTAAAFIQQPRSLILSLDPPRPVPVQQLMGLSRYSPDQVPTLLGLSLH